MNIFRKVYYAIKGTGRGIYNVFRWLPIIWKDRDWDYSYFNKITLQKLKNMKKFFESKDVYVLDAPQYAKQIGEVIRLLERVEKDDYEEEIEPHFYDWASDKHDFTKDVIDENGQRHCLWNGPDWTDEESARRMGVHEQAQKNKDDDRKKAYQIIAEKIEYWWD